MIIAVVLAVLLFVLACVLFAVKNPRAATQLVLSDQDYSSYVLLKNVRGKGEVYRPYLARLTENHAYDSEGAVSVELSKDMKDLINSEEVLETAQRYVEQLSFTGNTQTRGLQFSNELKLNDSRQTIFTHDLAYLASGIYSTVPEYGRMLTFLPLEEIDAMSDWEGSQLNKAKEILAFELTKLVHGEEEAAKAQEAAKALFSTGDAANMPTAEMSAEDFRDGKIDIITILQKSGLVPSRSEGRRAVEQGGVSVDGEKVTDFTKAYTAEEIGDGIVVKRGKKNFRKVVVK